MDECVNRLFYSQIQTKSNGSTRSLQVLTWSSWKCQTDTKGTLVLWPRDLVQTHSEKGVLTPEFIGWWSSSKADSFWSEPTEEQFFIPKTSECNTAHQTQNRLNWQPPGTSSLSNTGRALGKATHLFCPYPATSYCCKNTLSGANL